jgi:hypothetical protein
VERVGRGRGVLGRDLVVLHGRVRVVPDLAQLQVVRKLPLLQAAVKLDALGEGGGAGEQLPAGLPLSAGGGGVKS